MIKIDWRRSSMSPQGVLTVRGAYRYGAGYLVTLPDNLYTLGRTYVRTVHSFVMPDRPAKVEFIDKRMVIERDSKSCCMSRPRTSTTCSWRASGCRPSCSPRPWRWRSPRLRLGPSPWSASKARRSDSSPWARAGRSSPPSCSRPLRKSRSSPPPATRDKIFAISLPLTFRQGKEKGALELVRVKDHGPGSMAATEPRVLRITDLGLTYKHGQKNLLLWVTSLKTGMPMAEAQVLAFTRDLEVFPLGQTDKDGVLLFTAKELEGLSIKTLGKFEPVKRTVDRNQIVLLMVRTGDDLSYIEVQPEGNIKPENIWQVQVGQRTRNLNGHVFTERGVYRPGDKVFYKGTVREYLKGRIAPAQDEVVFLEVTNPKGEQVFTAEERLSDFGTAAGEILTQSHWPLGTYTLKMKFGPETKVRERTPRRRYRQPEEEGQENRGKPASHEVNCTFMIQEFKAPRHFVEIGFQRFSRVEKGFVNREPKQELVRITISGGYFAGGPVKNGQVRWRIKKSKTSYQVAGYDGYTFGYTADERGDLLESGQTVLDAKGQATIEFPLDKEVLAGYHGLEVVASVVDFDGLASSNNKVFQIEPEILVGISQHPENIKSGDGQILKLTVVRKDGQKIPQGRLQVELMLQQWVYVAQRNEQGDVYWAHQETWRKTSAAELSFDKGEGLYQFDLMEGGRYLVAFTYRDEQGRTYTSSTTYEVSGDYYWETYENRKRPYEALALSADQTAYKPGQTARLSVRPRRPVSCYLLTLEREGVVEHRVVPAKAGLKYLEAPIRAEHAPNVFVSVLALTPRGDFPGYASRYDSEAPGFYWGNLNLSVRQELEPLEVKIAPTKKELKAAPGATVELDLLAQSKDGKGVEAELAVAVVDEAVLALTRFKTPNLEQLARFDLPLSVYTGELRLLLVHQTPFYLAKIDTLTGGDGLSEEQLAKMRKRFTPVAFFDPAVRTDAQGRAKVAFVLPDNMTTYRVYVVAQDKGSRFANPERPLLAVKDFYLEPGLPSFFTLGDRFRFQVAAFNTTAESGPLKFKVATEGGLKLTPEPPKEELKAKDSLKLHVSGQAFAPGPAKARFGGDFKGKIDALELGLRVNSGHVRETSVFFGALQGPAEIRAPLPDYLRTLPWDKVGGEEVKAVLTLSGSPFVRTTEAINYLLTYPYGCVEQTSSGVLGLVGLRAAIKGGLVPGVTLEETDKYLKKGVDRLLAMQTETGAFSYWPGQQADHLWGTLYATAALSLAKVHGVSVPEEVLKKAVEFLKTEIRSDKHGADFKGFAAYILALNRALDRDLYTYLSRDYAKFHRETKVLLLLAAHQAGLRPAAELRPALKALLAAPAEMIRESWGDEFEARYRGPALALLAAKGIMPDDPMTRQMALYLLSGMSRLGMWTSTSDTGWALLALGEYFKGQAFATKPVEVTVTQARAPAPAPQDRPPGLPHPGPGCQDLLEKSGGAP